MDRIFISYRRADSTVYVKLLHDRLIQQFGKNAVFMDEEQINLGDEFARVIDEKLATSDVVLAVIGPRWLTLADETGTPRIHAANDFVRQEIGDALAREIPVIPVLVNDAGVPQKEDLPVGIAGLADRNAFEVRNRSLDQDIDTLIAHLMGQKKGFRQAFDALTKRLRLRRAANVIVPALVLIVFFAAWVNLFDYLTLDTKIESYTIWLGSLFENPLPSDEIAIVPITTQSEAYFHKVFDKTWRHEHARLIEALSRAGANVIAFDLSLKGPSPYDTELVAAIESARRNGTAVIFGTRGEPSGILGFEEAVTGLGHTCAGTKLGFARTVPLAIDDQQRPIAALALLAATGGGVIEDIDIADRQIKLITPDGSRREIWFARHEVAAGPQRNCQILEKGDILPQIIVRFLPVELYRSPAIRYRYEDIVGKNGEASAEQLQGKIVLVGQESIADTISTFRGFRSEERFGFEVHADVLNTLLQKVHIYTFDSWRQLFIMLCMAALGTVPRLMQRLKTPILRRLYCMATLAAYLVMVVLLYVQYKILLNPLYHISAFFMAYWVMGKAAQRLGLLETSEP